MSPVDSIRVCEMTHEGIEEARDYLSILRDGKRLRSWGKDLDDLLGDPFNATPVDPEIRVQHRPFASRREAGQYLQPIPEPIGAGRIAGNHLLWSWLGMFYLQQAAPPGISGDPQLSRGNAPYLLDPHGPATADRSGQLHRLMVAYEIFVRHGEKAWCMLDQPLYRMEHFTMRIVGTTSRAITFGSRAVTTGCRMGSWRWAMITGAVPGWTHPGRNGNNSFPWRPIFSNQVPFFPFKSGHFARFKAERPLC